MEVLLSGTWGSSIRGRDDWAKPRGAILAGTLGLDRMGGRLGGIGTWRDDDGLCYLRG